MNRSLSTKIPFRSFLITVGLVAPAMAQNLTTFSNGTVANATAVNANFTALKDAVTPLQATVATLNDSVTTLTGAITVTSANDVGIGTATPRTRLEVGGNLTAAPSAGGSNFLRLAGAGDDAQLYFFCNNAPAAGIYFNGFTGSNQGEMNLQTKVAADASPVTRLAIATDGKITIPGIVNIAGNTGIGVAAPSQKLDVAGNLKLRTLDRLYLGDVAENTDPVYFVRENGGVNNSILTMVLGDDPAGGSTGDSFFIQTRDSSGGSVNTRFVFNSDGNAFKAGTQPGWGTISDERVKHDIRPLEGSLERLLKLEGHTFYYNDPDMLGAGPGLRIGFVAQEVERVFPEWVSEFQGNKSLGVFGFEALTVEALREVDTRAAGMEKRMKQLETENAELKSRLASLEALQEEVAKLKASFAAK